MQVGGVFGGQRGGSLMIVALPSPELALIIKLIQSNSMGKLVYAGAAAVCQLI